MYYVFLETTVRIRLDAHIKTIVVLIGGKLTTIYFLHLLFAIYYFVTTDLR
jgi:1,4-dihydroxy-2-naphthoate octaprenyltransferase